MNLAQYVNQTFWYPILQTLKIIVLMSKISKRARSPGTNALSLLLRSDHRKAKENEEERRGRGKGRGRGREEEEEEAEDWLRDALAPHCASGCRSLISSDVSPDLSTSLSCPWPSIQVHPSSLVSLFQKKERKKKSRFGRNGPKSGLKLYRGWFRLEPYLNLNLHLGNQTSAPSVFMALERWPEIAILRWAVGMEKYTESRKKTIFGSQLKKRALRSFNDPDNS